MSSLRLIHSKNDPDRGEEPTGPSGEPAEVARRVSSSVRLQSIVEKVYKLESDDVNPIQVLDQLIDDLLAEARDHPKRP